jgi:hypothetical protein
MFALVVCFLLGNSLINTPTFLKPSRSSHLPPYEDGTECSETSAYKIQTPENYPEESVQHSEQGESLKSKMLALIACTSRKKEVLEQMKDILFLTEEY